MGHMLHPSCKGKIVVGTHRLKIVVQHPTFAPFNFKKQVDFIFPHRRLNFKEETLGLLSAQIRVSQIVLDFHDLAYHGSFLTPRIHELQGPPVYISTYSSPHQCSTLSKLAKVKK